MIPFMPYSDLYTLNLDWLLKKAGEYDQLFKGIKATATDGETTGVAVSVGPDGGYQFDFTIKTDGVSPVETTVIIHKTVTATAPALAQLEYSKIKTETEAGKLPIVQDENYNFYFPALGIHQEPGKLTYARLDDQDTKKIVFLVLNISDSVPGWKRHENVYATQEDVAQAVIPAHAINDISVITTPALNRPSDSGNLTAFSNTDLMDVGSVSIPAHTTAFMLGFRQTSAVPYAYAWAFSDTNISYENSTDNPVTVGIRCKAFNNSNQTVSSLGLGKIVLLLVKNDNRVQSSQMLQSVMSELGKPAEIEQDVVYVKNSATM